MYDAQPTRAMSSVSDHEERRRQLRKPSTVKEITVKRAANKGYIATHHFDNSSAGESYRSPEDHAFSSHDEMLSHMRDWAYGAGTKSQKMIGGQKEAPTKAQGRAAARQHGRGVD